jgi:hypothetical protein
MRLPIAAFLALSAVSTAALAERQVPMMSIECAAQHERMARLCPISGGDAASFRDCKSRNGDVVSAQCVSEARARMQAVRSLCRAGNAPGTYRAVCSALN